MPRNILLTAGWIVLVKSIPTTTSTTPNAPPECHTFYIVLQGGTASCVPPVTLDAGGTGKPLFLFLLDDTQLSNTTIR